MKIDPSVQVAFCGALESIINKTLQFDPGSRHALARLQGKVLAVEFTQPALSFYILPIDTGVRIHSIYDGEVTTRIKGTPPALVGLLQSKQLNLANSGVEVFGSTAFLIELQNILQELDIDWEEAISTVIGDVAGPQVSAGISGFGQWLTERKQSFDRLLGEFLTEEIRATPSRSELEYFSAQVDELRLAVDRAAATIRQLQSTRATHVNKDPE